MMTPRQYLTSGITARDRQFENFALALRFLLMFIAGAVFSGLAAALKRSTPTT